MSKIINKIKTIINQSNKISIIVFPEGHHSFIEKAAIEIKKESNIKPLLIVSSDGDIKKNGLDYISIESYKGFDEMANKLFKLREAKGLSLEEAKKLLKQTNYFATMLVKTNKAHGYVGGIEYTTADTLRPALQIIRTEPGTKIVSSAFIMEKEEEQYLFADCAINLEPNAEEIVEITKQVINLGLTIAGMESIRTALLSYSTDGSGKGRDAEKMEKAYEILKKEDLKGQRIFGSMQFDAAFVKSVMDKKVPNLKWEDNANAFIFPNLSSGNIGYKIAQRMGGYSAIGPILLGLSAPVNDLSRGASIQDIKDVVYITAAQVVSK